MIKKITSKSSRPRLHVFKSNKHLYAQIIDDINKKVLCGSSSISTNIKSKIRCNTNCKVANLIGQDIANKAKHIGITKVIFDRGSHIYHGKIKTLADAARSKGVNF